MHPFGLPAKYCCAYLALEYFAGSPNGCIDLLCAHSKSMHPFGLPAKYSNARYAQQYFAGSPNGCIDLLCAQHTR